MKVVKGAVKIIGAVASIAALIPGPHQPIAALVAAGSAIASTALEVIAPTKPRRSVSGSQTQIRLDPNAGIPYVIGRTFFAGNLVHVETWGPDNQYYGQAIVYSLGPIQSFEGFTADYESVTFDGSYNAVGSYAGWMYNRRQVGDTPSTALPSPVAGFPGIGASTIYSGYAVSHLVMKYDTKNGKKFSAGAPRTGEIIIGPKVYDPRLDGSIPGGSGSCRPLQFGTYVGAGKERNPWLQAITLALGIEHNGTRVFGVGAPFENINVQSFIDCANVSDANGWETGGVVYSTDDKWEVLKMLAQAGGGQIFRTGGMITAFCETPRISVATITAEHLIGRASVAASQIQRTRKNGVVPLIRSEAHGWEIIAADPVRIEDYVTEDGRRITEETDFILVQDKDQAAELAMYEILNSREIGPIELPVMVQFLAVEPGDQVDIDIDDLGLQSQEAVVMSRSINATNASVGLICRSETTGKHALALGTTTTVPPSPTLTGPDLAVIPQPGGGAWVLSAAQIVSGATIVPILRIIGATDLPTATGVIVEYRPVEAPVAAWRFHSTQAQSVEQIEISQVTPNTEYEVAISYIRRGIVGARLSLGTVTTGAMITGSAASAIIADNIVNQGDFATKDTLAWNDASFIGKPHVFPADSVTMGEELNDNTIFGSVAPGDILGPDAFGDLYIRSLAPKDAIVNFANSTVIDPNATYEASWEIFEEGVGAGSEQFYTVIAAWDASGNIINGDGTYWRYPDSYVVLGTKGSFYNRTSVFGKGTIWEFPANAVRFSIGALLSYGPGPSHSEMRVKKMKTRRLEEEKFVGVGAFRTSLTTFGSSMIWNGAAQNLNWGLRVAYSKRITTGPVRFTAQLTGPYEKMIGFSSEIPASYSDFDFAFYYLPDGSIQAYSFGAYQGTIATGYTNPNDVRIAMEYDGYFVRWFLNENPTPIKVMTAGKDKSYRIASDCYRGNGEGFKNIQAAPARTASLMGNNTYDASGILKVQGDIVTLEGVAANIVGQAPAATDGSIQSGATKNQQSGNLIANTNDFIGHISTHPASIFVESNAAYPGPLYDYFRVKINSISDNQLFYIDGYRFVPVKPLERLYGHAMVHRNSADGGVKLVALCYRGDGSYIGEIIVAAADATLTNQAWLPINGSAVVPSDCAKIISAVVGLSNNTVGNWWLGEPYIGRSDLGADVTSSASGSPEIILDYDSTGTLTTPLPATALYKLTPAGGSAYTAGVSWSVAILQGTFSGAAPTITGTGTGQLQINSGLAGPEAILAVTATYGGKAYPPVSVKIKKVTAAPPVGGGGGNNKQTSTFTPFSTTAFAAVIADLDVTLPTGVTTATLTATSLSLVIAAAAPSGATNVEMKWQRETSPGVWADVGAVATSSPHPETFFEPPSTYDPWNGAITCNRSATGLSAGSAQKFRLVARCSGGNTRQVTITGTAAVSS